MLKRQTLWHYAFVSILLVPILSIFLAPPSWIEGLVIFMMMMGGFVLSLICGFILIKCHTDSAKMPSDFPPELFLQRWHAFLLSTNLMFFGLTMFILTAPPFSLVEDYCGGTPFEWYKDNIPVAMLKENTNPENPDLMLYPDNVLLLGYSLIFGVQFLIPKTIRESIKTIRHLSLFYWYSPVLFTIGRNIKILEATDPNRLSLGLSFLTIVIFASIHVYWQFGKRVLWFGLLPLISVVLGYILAVPTFLIGMENISSR